MRKIWDGINKLIHNKTTLSNSITSLRDPVSNEIVYNTSKLSNIINKNFTSVGPKLTSKIASTNKHFSDYLSHIKQKDSFFFIPVTKQEIEDEICALTTRKSYGLYSCAIIPLKEFRHLISERIFS